MKIAIYTRDEKYLTLQELKNILLLTQKYNITAIFNCEYADFSLAQYSIKLDSYSVKNCGLEADFMISYGGDGTFLHAVAILGHSNIPILGVNSGRLGFLSSVDRGDIDWAIEQLILGVYSIEKRSMIEVSGDFKKSKNCKNSENPVNFEKFNEINDNSDEKIFPYIFNEFTLQKSELNMVDITLEINNQHVASIAADGLIVSTPSGSTAYSLSSGGAILSPDCKAFIITPIAPHNLTLRPIVVDENVEIMMSVNSRIGECYATLDNRAYKVESGAKFYLRRAKHSVSIVKLNGNSFFDRLQKKLMWASENRY
ncbi:MAG: NAD(+)/NADH kinase [Rikenellaceae bacterium]